MFGIDFQRVAAGEHFRRNNVRRKLTLRVCAHGQHCKEEETHTLILQLAQSYRSLTVAAR